MQPRFPVIASLLFLVLQSFDARADDVKVGDPVISRRWSRATPGGAKVASGYLTIANRGAVADRLLGRSADIGSTVDVHDMTENGGVISMRTLVDGLTLAPGATVTLASGGHHLMLNDIKAPLRQGDTLPVTLKFEKAGDVAVTFKVLGSVQRGPLARSRWRRGQGRHEDGPGQDEDVIRLGHPAKAQRACVLLLVPV